MEKHTTITWDGFILDKFRIPSSMNDTCDNTKLKQPILFVHGTARDARCWLLMGTKSPAFYYASKCYDVWLANTTGTAFCKHASIKPYSKTYWDFSFHEQATRDIPAKLDLIANVTGQAGNIIYMGHSMGTTMAFVYCSVNVTHCRNNLRAIIALGPIANLNKIKVPFFHFFARTN
ncbi:lipase member K-like [Aethina tumida]|uniref:lipase member K-like n=1 Tax=Aethina tumida TaxID=116153 RepID=UPI0021479C68|nr:lipase member K-like [Aethina tumida]